MMKHFCLRLLALTLTAVLLLGSLTGCKGFAVKVSVSKNPSGVGLVWLMEKNKQRKNGLAAKYKFTVSDTSNNAADLLVNKKADIAVIAADKAAKLVAGNDDFVCLGYASLADYALYAVDDNIRSYDDLVGRTVYLVGDRSVGNTVLNKIYEQKGLSAKINTTIRFRNTNKALREEMKLDQKGLILVSHPFAYTLMSKTEIHKVLDVAATFAELYPDVPLIGDCIVARRKYVDGHKEKVREFLSEYKASVEKCELNNAESGTLSAKHGVASAESTGSAILYGGNLRVVTGKQAKQDMEAFYRFLASYNSLTIGAEPTESFYYIFD